MRIEFAAVQCAWQDNWFVVLGSTNDHRRRAAVWRSPGHAAQGCACVGLLGLWPMPDDRKTGNPRPDRQWERLDRCQASRGIATPPKCPGALWDFVIIA